MSRADSLVDSIQSLSLSEGAAALKTAGKKHALAVAKIAKMTDINNHPAALAAGAALLGDKELKKAFEGLGSIQDYDNGLYPDVGKVRKRLSETLMKKAKAKLSPAQYDQFTGAF